MMRGVTVTQECIEMLPPYPVPLPSPLGPLSVENFPSTCGIPPTELEGNRIRMGIKILELLFKTFIIKLFHTYQLKYLPGPQILATMLLYKILEDKKERKTGG
jgi:hypothetical protein